MKKNEKKESKIPEKEYFTVKLETLVPVTFTYRVLAETPEEAVKIASRPGHAESAPPQILFHAARKIKAKVYNLGTVMMRLVKNF